MTNKETYQALANHLDSFPQGFPATKSGKELALLVYLFTEEEARFALYLKLDFKSLPDIALRAGVSTAACQDFIKKLVNKGLVNVRYGPGGTEASLQPFIVGFYESQVFRMDETLAQLVEDYFHEAMPDLLSVQPQFHRIIPVNARINSDVEILPEEDVTYLLSSKKAWAVLDCVCRKQQALLGKACDHPLRVCLAMSDTPGVFNHIAEMEALDLQTALRVLDMAAKSGLVHTVSNRINDITYVCSCCTCGCGLLRGIAEAHIANVVARSAYYAVVDERLCTACGNCALMCQFDAITIKRTAIIDTVSCTGCGVCTRICPEGAIKLARRPENEIKPIPESADDWLNERRKARHLK